MEFLVKTMNDTLYPKRRLRPADRLEAPRILAERGFGRVPLANEGGERPEIIVIRLKPNQNF